MSGLAFLEGTGAVIRTLISFSFWFTLFHENSWQLLNNPHCHFFLRSCMYGCSIRINDVYGYMKCAHSFRLTMQRLL
jgi:tRNA splicing endonuclease